MMSNHMQAVRIFKALADESRLEIMLLLMDGERCACQLLDALKIGQSTLSHHMRILCESGLVQGYEDGTFKPDISITRGQAAMMILNCLAVLGK